MLSILPFPSFQYESECEMRRRSCETGVAVALLHRGPCHDMGESVHREEREEVGDAKMGLALLPSFRPLA